MRISVRKREVVRKRGCRREQIIGRKNKNYVRKFNKMERKCSISVQNCPRKRDRECERVCKKMKESEQKKRYSERERQRKRERWGKRDTVKESDIKRKR